MKGFCRAVFGSLVILAAACATASAQSTYFGMSCPGAWVNNGVGMMCRCPNGSYANMIGGRIVCPSSAPPRRTTCPPGYYVNRSRCVKVGQFVCPNGRHACRLGDTCTATGCRPAGASACPHDATKFCNAPLSCATDLQGNDKCFTASQIEALDAEIQTRDVISTIDTRSVQLQGVNRAFQEKNGMSYQNKIQQQKAKALEDEKGLPAARQQQLEKARQGTVDQLQQYADGLKKQAPQEAAYEAPLRVALNPDVTNPAKWSKLTPPPPASKQPAAAPKTNYVGSESTFTPLTRETVLRQQLQAERAHAKAIDDYRAKLLLAEIPFRTAVVAGSAAADKLGIGPAYSIATAAPGVLMGQTSAAEATGKVTGGYLAGKALKKAGAPPAIGTAAEAINQGVDWLGQWRNFQATRTR